MLSSVASSFSNEGGIPSGPAALVGSSFANFSCTQSMVMVMSCSFSFSGPLKMGSVEGTPCLSSVKTEAKKLFNTSAVCCPGGIVSPSSVLSGPIASLTFCLDLTYA